MSSYLLHKLSASWEKQRVLMVKHHEDECADFKRERDARRKTVIEKAQRQLESLHNTVAPGVYEERADKVRRERDDEIAAIQKEYGEGLRAIKEIQRKEKLNHDAAYHDAIAARSARAGTWPSSAAASAPSAPAPATSAPVTSAPTTPASATSSPAMPTPKQSTLPDAQTVHTPVKTTSAQVSPRSTARLPREDVIIPNRHSNITRTRVPAANTASPVKQPLRVDTSVSHLPTPTSTESAFNKVEVSRTVTFDEVYKNGEALHKDTIIEFPENSGDWFIVMCKEHDVRFTQRPLLGATLHLNSKLHGYKITKGERAETVKLLGYRVLNCTRELAEMNNAVVQRAYAEGYIPMGNRRPPEYSLPTAEMPRKKRKYTRRATLVNANDGAADKGLRTIKRQPTKKLMITNPKPFHVYYCYWQPERSMYPVVILGWNDLTPGGIDHPSLATTGLLDNTTATPPKCYLYQATNDGVYSGIVGWAPGYEDGGRKVRWRKFPVMFFDKEQSFSWVSARTLSNFPLFKTEAPKRPNHPFNVARQWIAKQAGFSTWEQFAKDRKPQNKEMSSPVLPMSQDIAPDEALNNVGSDVDKPDHDSDAEGSVASSDSHVTERELQAVLERAGADDSDYDDSPESDDSPTDESALWFKNTGEGSSRPWAFYSLRNMDKDNKVKREKSSPSPTRGVPDEASSRKGSLIKVDKTAAEHSDATRPTSAALPVKKAETQSPKSAPAVQSTKDSGVVRASSSTVELPTTKISSTGEKRARSEGEADEVFTSSQELVKRPRMDADDKSSITVAVPPVRKPISGIKSSFKPKQPLEPAGFEVVTYEKQSISWSSDDGTACAKLYYGENDATLGTVEGPVDIFIDPATIESFKREDIPGAKGNNVMILLDKGPDKVETRLVFDRTRGSKAEIGKIQIRSFIRWLRTVRPGMRFLN